MRILSCILSALLVVGGNAHAQSTTTKPLSKSLTLIQSITGISTLATSYKATAGNVDFAPDAGLRSYTMGTQISNPSSIASVSPSLYGDGTNTPGQIKALAKGQLLPRATAVSAALRAWMQANGVSSATYLYEQEVKPKNVARNMKIVWQLLVTDSGRAIYGDPKVIDGDPTIVYMYYTSKAVDAGLPATWTYGEGGMLKWQLRRKDGTPATSWVTVDTLGAFDEPVSGTEIDPNLGVKCLTDKTSVATCPSAFIDAKTLIEQNGSLGAIIDYVRKVQPVYDEVADPANPGQVLYQARTAISYDNRELAATCGVSIYRNAGRYGFALATTVDRFFVDEGTYQAYQVNSFKGTSISPTQNFDYSFSTTLRSAQLQSQVINPITGVAPLIEVNSLTGVAYLAPITINGDNSGVTYLGSSLKHVTAETVGNVTTILTDTDWRGRGNLWPLTDYIEVNITKGNLVSAEVIVNNADDANLIFLNDIAVAATDWPPLISYPDANGLDVYPPDTGRSIETRSMLSAYLPSIPPSGYVYYSPPYAYCNIGTSQTDGSCGFTEQLAILPTTINNRFGSQNIFVLQVEHNGASYDSSLPRNITPQVVNGLNRINVQHLIGGSGQSKTGFRFTTCVF